jgi:hypothetical protein
MTTRAPDRLYELLPAVYRERDADEGHTLRALLRLVEEQSDLVESDVAQLWNDLFIETCRRWVIPYIGDLVSNNLLYDAARMPQEGTADQLFTDLIGPDLRPRVAVRTRADVAKTIYYRRRKGTPPMLEELARDVIGWPAHLVEFFELLGWTQHLEHFRPQAAWFDVRSLERNERVDGPFDEASHSVDVRHIAQFEGWHSIKNIGFFLWRLRAFPLADVPARAAGVGWGFHFSPLGNRAPLFALGRREADETGLATELHVEAPIRRAFFARDLALHGALPAPATDLYGPGASIAIVRNGNPVPPSAIRCRRLDPWPAAQPTGTVVAVDVASGRLAIGAGLPGVTNTLDVSFAYGFPTELGGGPYERRAWLVDPALDTPTTLRFRVASIPVSGPAPTHANLTVALSDWATAGRPDTVISIADSRTYTLPATITLADGGRLAIEAENEQRPVLQTAAGGFRIDSPAVPPPDPELRGELTLSGVVVEGSVRVVGDLRRLRLLHSTLVPGRSLTEDGAPAGTAPSIVVEATRPTGERINARLRVEAAFVISGPVVCPEHAEGIWVLDSILDGLGGLALQAAGGDPTAPLDIERSTILGGVRAHSLDASESIFTDLVRIARTQAGCVRFSFVPRGSRTPRRYRCQPDLGIRKALDEALAVDPTLTTAQKDAIRAYVAGWLRPSFTTRRYGQPAYCQLRLAAPAEIRTGAEDGSEMGVYCHVKQPQRESNLSIRLEEYLPFGLEAGVIYVD